MHVIAVVLGALLALSSTSVRADELQVTVASGALSGFASRDGLVRSFKGIPYAKARECSYIMTVVFSCKIPLTAVMIADGC